MTDSITDNPPRATDAEYDSGPASGAPSMVPDCLGLIEGGQGRTAEEVMEWGEILLWLGMIGSCLALWVMVIVLVWRCFAG